MEFGDIVGIEPFGSKPINIIREMYFQQGRDSRSSSCIFPSLNIARQQPLCTSAVLRTTKHLQITIKKNYHNTIMITI